LNKITVYILFTKNTLPVILTVLFLGLVSVAQETPDLERKAETSVKKVRGGETFFYTFTVTNRADKTVKDVLLAHEIEEKLTLISASVTRGSYRTVSSNYRTRGKRILAELGDIEGYASASLTIEAKVVDWGDISAPLAGLRGTGDGSGPFREPLRVLRDGSQAGDQKTIEDGKPAEFSTSLVMDFPHVRYGEGYYLEHDDSPRLTIALLPSRNIPPRVQIISPKTEAVFVKPLTKEIEVPIGIKAFDPDGAIKKVVVQDMYNPPKFGLKMEDDGVYKYVVAGKTYTQEEMDERRGDDKFSALYENRLPITASGNYSYTAKRFMYGINMISICATDDGGRETCTDTSFTIKSDSVVELVKPAGDVFLPNSVVTVETVSKIGEGVTPKIVLYGTKDFYEPDHPVMQLVSRTGNTYVHRYTWTVGEEGLYDLRPTLLENGQDTGIFASLRTVAALPRVIKITSLRNGQVFSENDRITVTVQATDINGKILQDKLVLLVDGRVHGDVSMSQTIMTVSPYRPVSAEYSGSYMLNIKPGPHTVQVIASHEYGTKLGRSDVINITVK